MNKKIALTPVATAFAATLAAAPVAQAGDNPFALVEFRGGLQVAEDHGEMKCGANMDMGQADKAKDAAQEQTQAETAKAGDATKTEAQSAAGK